jgi:DNA-binding MarR family transcriptional regulator
MEGLGTTLRKLVDALDGGVQAHYDATGLNFRPRFYPVARYLQAGQVLSIRALANATGVSHSALSQTVGEMRSAGLVTSSPGQDGRERLIELTANGREACGRLQGLWDAVARAAAGLDAELSMPLGDLLRETASRLNAEDFASRIARNLEPGVVNGVPNSDPSFTPGQS